MGEFDLIDRYFKRPASRNALGIGDDCALLRPAPGMHLAVSCDMLVEGRHFLPTVDPFKLGHKALAVNLSDLAACGAGRWLSPGPGAAEGRRGLAGAVLARLAGAGRRAWLRTGGRRHDARAAEHLHHGLWRSAPGPGLLRSGAQAGDDIYVSGPWGMHGWRWRCFAARCRSGRIFNAARARLEQPTPRLALGQALRGIANSAIDVSDGLLGDLGHILKQSAVGARIETSLAAGLMASEGVMNEEGNLEYILAGETTTSWRSPHLPRDATRCSRRPPKPASA